MELTQANATGKRRRWLVVITLALLLLIASVAIEGRMRSRRLHGEVARLQEQGIPAMVVKRPAQGRLLRSVPHLREFFGTERIAIYLHSSEAAWKLYLMSEVESLDSIGYTFETEVEKILPMLKRKYGFVRLRGEFPDAKSWAAVAPTL